MEPSLPSPQDFTLDDLREHPHLVTDVLLRDEDVSLLLERRGDTVRLACLRRYDRETTRVLAEAKNEHARKVKEGYTRDQAFADLREALTGHP